MNLPKRRENTEAAIKVIKSQLSEKQRLFLVYKEKLTEWVRAKAELQGDREKRGSIAWYSVEIEALDTLPAKREQSKTVRLGIVRRLHEQIGKVVAEYRTLYQPVQGFVQSTTTRMEMPLPLDFDVRIAEEGFQEMFLGRINRQTRGSFSGVDESNLLIRGLLKETDFMSADAVVTFVQNVDDMLHFDRRVDVVNHSELSVVDQLRNNIDEVMESFFFGQTSCSPDQESLRIKSEPGLILHCWQGR